jgi:phosphoesterase RecJ-like protein
MSLKKVAACVKKNKRFLISAHTNLEGDALGAELAFWGLLKKLGKSALILNQDRVPPGYKFLPGLNKVSVLPKGLKRIKFDCFAVLDCSGLKRTGEVYKLNTGSKTLLNIDHHISNERFGDVNWVDPHASSCSEMIYRLYKELRVPLDKNSATSLYVGMLTDTGSFRYSNTSSFTHSAVSELLKYGLDIPRIYKNIYENMPFCDMELLVKILAKMKLQAGGRISWLQVSRDDLGSRRSYFDLGEHILSFARSIAGIEVAVLFKEDLADKNEIRVNFRSCGKIDVNKIAGSFGGGGHKTASGATINGKIDQVRKKVLARIKKELDKPRRNS